MSEPVADAAFDACNMRLLDLAHNHGKTVVLLALLEASALQKSGGSAQFVAEVRRRGGRVEAIDVTALREQLGR